MLDSEDTPGCSWRCHDNSFPAAFLTNEVGCIFINEKSTEAEGILVSLLGHPDISTKYAAYCMLNLGFELISENTVAELENFTRLPENADIVEASKIHFPDGNIA